MTTAAEEIKRQIRLDLEKSFEKEEDKNLYIDLEDYVDQWFSEGLYEFRDSYDEETDIKCDWSRHYESKSVAKKLDNGKWVGYTYWYGGGKHGEPEAIDWIDDAYFLEMKEEMRPVRTFTKIQNNNQ